MHDPARRKAQAPTRQKGGARKPTDNAFIEAFNRRFRDECLNLHWFASLDEAQATIEAWRVDDNTARPHGALGQQTPAAFSQAWTAPVETDLPPESRQRSTRPVTRRSTQSTTRRAVTVCGGHAARFLRSGSIGPEGQVRKGSMDLERRIARVRAALEASEGLLRAPADQGTDPTSRAELGGHLGELRRLLDALEGDGARAGRGDADAGPDGARSGR